MNKQQDGRAYTRGRLALQALTVSVSIAETAPTAASQETNVRELRICPIADRDPQNITDFGSFVQTVDIFYN